MEKRHYRWILREAKRRGYRIRKAPSHYATPGRRVGGSKKKIGSDRSLTAFREDLVKVATAYHTAEQTTGATIALADDLALARENYVTALRLVRNAVRYG